MLERIKKLFALDEIERLQKNVDALSREAESYSNLALLWRKRYYDLREEQDAKVSKRKGN